LKLSEPRPARIDFCPDCGAWLDVRSIPQNSKLHAMITELSKVRQWAGEWLSVEDWKRLIIAAYCRANQMPAKLYPALDGQGFDVVYRRTSRMGKKEMIQVIDWLAAWCAEQGFEIH